MAPPILVGRHDAAEIMGVHPATIYRWTRKGLIPAIYLPSGTIRYDKAALVKMRAGLRAVEKPKTKPKTVTNPY